MKRAEHQPEQIDICLYAGVFIKTWSVRDAGTLLPQHAHSTGHVTAITAGSVRAWRGDEMLGDFHAPAMIRIPANTLHQFLTLTDNVALACIHNADHIVEGEEPAVSEYAFIDLED